jgi:hypothetical protein
VTLEYDRGDDARAIALGLILLAVALLTNSIMHVSRSRLPTGTLLTLENVMRSALVPTNGPSFNITFKVAFVAVGIVPDGVVGGVDVVLDGVGDVVELLQAITVSANMAPPTAARRIYRSSEGIDARLMPRSRSRATTGSRSV